MSLATIQKCIDWKLLWWGGSTVWSSWIVCVIIPHNGPKCSLEADLHVQWVGTLEVDIDEEVPDDEISGQGEVVSVDGMGPIVLWYKK